jgi:hypothetical protein
MSVVWSLAAGAVAYLLFRDWRAGAVVGLAVFSHWVLDFISHSHGLPVLFARTPLLGLGLVSSVPISLAMELTLLAVGVASYIASRKRKASPSGA